MAYDVKNVFYLDMQMEMPLTATTAPGESNTVQLDLSAYIDPIARGRSKGTGLAIYKVHYAVSGTSEGYLPANLADSGIFRGGLIAGAGLGTTTGVTLTGQANSPAPDNALAIMGFDFYGPDSTGATGPSVPSPLNRTFLEPSKEVPYVVVRDNVCAVATMEVAMQTVSYVNFRLECAQITLDQATLNQLLRTQTV
jgi:hypothetical protein